MANNLRKKKQNQSPRNQRKGNKPFDPLAPSFTNQRQFRRAIRARTQGQFRPQVRELRRQARAERRQSKGNKAQIRNDYRYLGDHLRSSADRMRESSNELMGQFNTGAQQSQQAMLDAIMNMQGADAARAQLTGATNAPDTNVQANTAAVASQGVPTTGSSLGALLAAQAASAQDRISDAALGRNRALQSERDRLRSTLEGIRDERKDIIMGIPAIREEMRKRIMDEEIAKQSERARQRIAAQSVDLDWARLAEDARQADAQIGLGYAQLAQQGRIDQQKIRLQRQQLRMEISNAKTKAQKEAAKAKADNYDKLLKSATNYVRMYGENIKNLNPGAMFRMLRGQGASAKEALDLMSAFPGPPAKWARQAPGGRKRLGPTAPGDYFPGPFKK